MQDRNEAGNPLDTAVPHPMSRRWIPYKHIATGSAIYFHQNVCEGHDYLGGEFMISIIIRGTPEQCLAALTHRSSTTSILGPAAAVNVLSSDQQSQVLHIQLLQPVGAAAGWAGVLCARRHAVVRQTLQQDHDGIHCLMFSSLPAKQAHKLLQQRTCHQHNQHHHQCQQQQQRQQQMTGLQQGTLHHHQQRHHRRHRHHRLASSSSSSSSLWPPVLVDVSGGFTVSGLTGFDDEDTPETLVTQIVKVDFGGWLSEASWLQQSGLVQSLTDAWREQLLTAVLLAKEEVETQRFRSYPFAVLGEQQQQHSSLPVRCHTSNCSRSHHSCSCHCHCNSGSSNNTAAATAGVWLDNCQHSSSSWLGGLQSLLQLLQPWSKGWAARAGFVPGRSSSWPEGAAGFGSAGFSDAAAGLSGFTGSAAEAQMQQLVGRDGLGQPLRGWCDPLFWSELHQPGGPAPFKVRGPHYLSDRAKVAAGAPAYHLIAVDLVTTPAAVQHLARFLPSVRRSRAASCFVINMMVPSVGSVLNLVMVFGSSSSWRQLVKDADLDSSNSSSGSRSRCSSTSSMAAAGAGNSSSSIATGASSSSSSSSLKLQPESRWSSFDHALYRFIHGSDNERSNMFKLIPHLEVGSWVLKQMIGTTPVIVGRKLATTYHLTDRYMEVDIDVTTCKTAGYIVNSIRGMTTSLVIDLSYLLEGQRPAELPEVLLGAVRFSNLDMGATRPLDVSRDVPCWPEPWADE